METPFPPFDPDGSDAARQHRLRDIPLRAIVPNLITLLAICAGLTSLRFAVEGKIGTAVAAIILAALLDGLDGRIARFLKSTSRFGAQMDSLADFLNFGVAPALLIYFTLINALRSIGWIVTLVYVICAGLRLARFNAMIDMPDVPKWQANYFVGVPAPAAALCVLAPIYGLLVGAPASPAFASLAAFHTLMISLLMVSNLPTFSGKELGSRIPRDYVLPLMLALIIFVALLFSYPWSTLLIVVLVYLATLPLGLRSWRRRRLIEERSPTGPAESNSDT